MEKTVITSNIKMEDQRRLQQEISSGKLKMLSWRNGKLRRISQDYKNIGKEYGTPFKEIIVKRGPDGLSNRTDKIIKKADNKPHINKISVKSPVENSVKAVKNTSVNVTKNKPVFVIKSQSGKTVKIVPKSISKIETDAIPKLEQLPQVKQENCSFPKTFKAVVKQELNVQDANNILGKRKLVKPQVKEDRLFQYPGKVEPPPRKIIPYPFKIPSSLNKSVSSAVKLESTSKKVPPNSVKNGKIELQHNDSKIKISLLNALDKHLIDNQVIKLASNLPLVKLFPNPFSAGHSQKLVKVSYTPSHAKNGVIENTPIMSIQKPIKIKLAAIPKAYQKTNQAPCQKPVAANIIQLPKKYPVTIKKIDEILETKKADKKNGDIVRIPSTAKKQHSETKFKKSGTKKIQESPTLNIKTENIKPVPVIQKLCIDVATQTDGIVVASTSMQTELKEDEIPDVGELVEYLMSSTTVEEKQKTNLIDVPKNITSKDKNPQSEPFKALQQPSRLVARQEHLKIQLFMDLNNCVFFDALGNLPIHNAVMENNMKVLKKQCFVLKLRNRCVDIQNNHGHTALQVALLCGSSLEMIKELINCGADCNVIDPDGNTSLHLAVIHSDPPIMNLIIKHCKEGTLDIKNDEGLTALMLTCIHRKTEMAEIILQKGANPNTADEKSGRTAFFHAVENESSEIVDLLMKYKADPKIRNFLGLTAMEAVRDPEVMTLKVVDEFRNSTVYKRSPSYDDDVDDNDETYKPSEKKRIRKSKLSFITSLQKVALSTIKEVVPRRKRKFCKKQKDV